MAALPPLRTHPGDPAGASRQEARVPRLAQRAADPVFDRLDQEFSGAPLIATLADGEARITDLRTTHPTAQDAIASIGLRRGVEMAEDVVGTNAIGTVLETRIPLMLHGTDHFAHAFSQFTCFGYPVIHPVTHRLEGVLNVGGSSTQEIDLVLRADRPHAGARHREAAGPQLPRGPAGAARRVPPGRGGERRSR